jgi:putative ABC transport system permease protein
MSPQRIETIRDARPEIRSGLERAERFLGLSTLLTVVLAGVAIALAARRHMQRHFDACAMMRCLGSVQGELLALYGLQFLLAGAIAALIGSLVGLGLQQILVTILSPLVQVQLPPPALWPMLQGFATGCILLGGFALPPLIALRKVSTMRVLRRDLGIPDPTGLSAYLLGGLAIAALILWQAGDLDLGWTVLAGVFATLLACATITMLAIRLLRRVFSDAQFGWRTGLANIRRRSMGSVLQVSAIGLGLLSLILLTLVRNDLLTTWQRTLPADAPNRFLVNIQTDQISRNTVKPFRCYTRWCAAVSSRLTARRWWPMTISTSAPSDSSTASSTCPGALLCIRTIRSSKGAGSKTMTRGRA